MKFQSSFWLLAVLLTLLAGTSLSVAFEYPAIAKNVPKIEAVVPAGWNILFDISRGDLNDDGIEDAVLVIEYEKPVDHEVLLWGIESTKPENYETSSPPRVLLVLFGLKEGGYSLALANSNIILRADMGGVIGDPFQGAEFNRGSVVISEFGGSRQRWGEIYRFRFRGNKWRLIGFTSSSIDVVTGKSREVDRNFLSGKMKISTLETEDEGEKPKVRWKAIAKSKRQYFLQSNMAIIN